MARALLADVRGASLFARAGPRPSDVRMGRGMEDCYVMAAAQAVAARCPQHLQAMVYTVDRHVIVQPPGSDAYCVQGSLTRWRHVRGGPRWPLAIEAAYAFARGGAHVLLTPGDPADSLTWLLGCAARTAWVVSWESCLDAVRAAHAQGECVVLHAKSHAYAVIDVLPEGVVTMDPRSRWWCGRKRLLRPEQPRSIVALSVTSGASCMNIGGGPPGCVRSTCEVVE